MTTNKQRDLLAPLRNKLSDRTCWTRKAAARDKYGHSISPRSRQACAWCLGGLIRAVVPLPHREAVVRELQERVEARKGHTSIAAFNDACDFDELHELLSEPLYE